MKWNKLINLRLFSLVLVANVMAFILFFSSDVASMSLSWFILNWSLVWLAVISASFINQKDFKVLQNSLQSLKKLNLFKEKLHLSASNIEELNELNSQLNLLTRQINEKYLNQKQYSENLSHELLTPLAIIRTKAELLMQSPHLREEDLINIDDILKTVSRLSKINQSFILLTKIKNNQFIDKQKVNLKAIIEHAISIFEDQIDSKSIQLKIVEKEAVVLDTNFNLLDILISNLIKNAVFHNVQDGFIQIEISSNTLKIINSGDNHQMNNEQLFNRFVSVKKEDHQIGLGLSIVKKICEVLHFQIHYHQTQNTHHFELNF